MATRNYKEYELSLGEGVVIQLPSGETVVVTINGVGVDLNGETVVEYELWSPSNNDLVVRLDSNKQQHIYLLDHEGLIVSGSFGEIRTSNSELNCEGWVRAWHLMRLLLSKSTRETVFMPVLHELTEDLMCDRSMAYSKREKLFVNLAFAIRTTKLLVECIFIDFSTSPVPWKWIFASLSGVLVAKLGFLALR
jgi:hypothetical protein